jgi:transcription elongation GreA/GreB family factor
MSEISNAEFLDQFLIGGASRNRGVILPFESSLIEPRIQAVTVKREDIIRERADAPLGMLGASDFELDGANEERRKLEDLLYRTVVGYPEPTEERVTLGSLVSIVKDAREATLAIVGFSGLHDGPVGGARPVSPEAPLIKQLIGQRAGETALIGINGASREVQVTAVDQLAIRQE